MYVIVDAKNYGRSKRSPRTWSEDDVHVATILWQPENRYLCIDRSVPGKHLKHSSRFWPAWALTRNVGFCPGHYGTTDYAKPD